MAYNELIKNFEKVRAYMREFYVYGFKSRTEYDAKSARSYDDERRRIESWLGEYMRFTQTAEGKNVFLSVDSRVTQSNPFYKAWKAKSFTDGDITLHFILFDILHSSDVKKTLTEIVEEIDEYLCEFESPMTFDESTVRKKLKEYASEGIICVEKVGRKVSYSRAEDVDIAPYSDVINFFSEVAPCGVIGSFLQDKLKSNDNIFGFKHHYMNNAMDSDILAQIFDAMSKKSYIVLENAGRKAKEAIKAKVVPLKMFISAQNGRQHLLAFSNDLNHLHSYRLDYIKKIQLGEVCPQFDDLREAALSQEKNMWGVSCRWGGARLEHIEFDVKVEDDEQHIVRRLEREKRCGRVDKIDDHHYRYSADVVDSNEMIPWIRTFICRITRISCSNKATQHLFQGDLRVMYQMYGIDGGDTK